MINLLKNIFKGKTKLERLEDKHKDLLHKAFVSSKTNRTLSDTFAFEASKVEEQIIEIKRNENN